MNEPLNSQNDRFPNWETFADSWELGVLDCPHQPPSRANVFPSRVRLRPKWNLEKALSEMVKEMEKGHKTG